MGSTQSQEQPECCPPGSHPVELSAANLGETRALRGTRILIACPNKGEEDRFEAYLTLPPNNQPPKAGIILIHDIFGFNGGRLHHIADDLAAQGFACLCPDLFDIVGQPSPVLSEAHHVYWPPWKIFTGVSNVYARIARPFETYEPKVLAACERLRSETSSPALPLGAVGCCHGAWIVLRFAGLAHNPFFAVGGWHPSPDVQRLQATGPTTDEMIRAVAVPCLSAPAWRDPAYLRPDSWWIKYLNEPGRPSAGSEAHLFAEMRHGWSCRGDLRDPAIKRDVELVIGVTVAFFEKLLRKTQT